MKKVRLRKGMILYHGTSAPEDFTIPNGPAWFSDSEAVARKFVFWHDYQDTVGDPAEWSKETSGRPRILKFRVTDSPKVALISDKRELEELMEETGIEELNYEELYPMSAYGYDGWTIPDNYGPGQADIMLLNPDQFLEFVEEYEVTERERQRNPTDLKTKLDELNRLAQTLTYYHWLKEHGISWSEIVSVRIIPAGQRGGIGLKLKDGREVRFEHIPFSEEVIFNRPFYTPAENPPATDIVLSRDYYHATPDGKAGESILKDGLIVPRPGKAGKAYMSPRKDFVYMSPQLYYAAIYALGGVFMGENYPERYWKGSRYGYIFLVHKGDLIDVEPDEDDVGSLATSKLKDDAPGWLKRMAYDEAMTSPAKNEKYRRAVFGEMAYQSLIGKQLLKRLSWDQKQFLMNMTGVNISNRGPVGFDAAWRLDKSRSREIAEDGSNVLEIAERIK